MNTSRKPILALEQDFLVIAFENGMEIRFPYKRNPRLAAGSRDQLLHAEITPFGIHWPELDEDLSFQGLANGQYGQNAEADMRVAETAERYDSKR